MYLYICIYIFIFIYYVFIYLHIYIFMYLYIFVVFIYLHIYIFIYLHIYIFGVWTIYPCYLAKSVKEVGIQSDTPRPPPLPLLRQWTNMVVLFFKCAFTNQIKLDRRPRSPNRTLLLKGSPFFPKGPLFFRKSQFLTYFFK